MAANRVVTENRVAVLLSVIGNKAYGLLRNLLSPNKLAEQSYNTLVSALQKHFEPKPIVIAERFHFYRQVQGSGESIAAYLAELKRLSRDFAFQGHLEEALRDQLVCGLRSPSIQKRLLAEADLTYAKAVDLALGMEAADKNLLHAASST